MRGAVGAPGSLTAFLTASAASWRLAPAEEGCQASTREKRAARSRSRRAGTPKPAPYSLQPRPHESSRAETRFAPRALEKGQAKLPHGYRVRFLAPGSRERGQERRRNPPRRAHPRKHVRRRLRARRGDEPGGPVALCAAAGNPAPLPHGRRCDPGRAPPPGLILSLERRTRSTGRAGPRAAGSSPRLDSKLSA